MVASPLQFFAYKMLNCTDPSVFQTSEVLLKFFSNILVFSILIV